jgi:2-phospho-L-lactate/phosphoenolpyruvate guanylyltransferase
MLLDVLDAVEKAGLLSQCYVISSSKRRRRLAEGAGARTIEEGSDSGVNSAIETGMGDVETDDLMVVPSDLPLLTAAEIRGALRLRAAGVEVVIAPSIDFDGTNLLLFSRSTPMELSFDRDSFWNHLEAAARKQLKVAVYSARGVRFDVDTASHLDELARQMSPGRAVALARKLVHQ